MSIPCSSKALEGNPVILKFHRTRAKSIPRGIPVQSNLPVLPKLNRSQVTDSIYLKKSSNSTRIKQMMPITRFKIKQIDKAILRRSIMDEESLERLKTAVNSRAYKKDGKSKLSLYTRKTRNVSDIYQPLSLQLKKSVYNNR